MKKSEIIIVQYVQDFVYTSKDKYIVHFAGVSDNPRKLMKLQVWEMPFDTFEEANETRRVYLEKINSNGSFMIVLNK